MWRVLGRVLRVEAHDKSVRVCVCVCVCVCVYALTNVETYRVLWGGCNWKAAKNDRSLLQNILSFIGLFCKRDL